MAEALTAWAEMLRDATGTPRGIEGVLVATAPGAPAPDPAGRAAGRPAAARTTRSSVVLDDLADDLDHPVGDLVVTALRLAARSGGRQIRSVLDDLATVAREEARMHRRVEVARARPRADMRSVLAIMGGFVLLFSIGARTYLERRTAPPLGQLVLAVGDLRVGGGDLGDGPPRAHRRGRALPREGRAVTVALARRVCSRGWGSGWPGRAPGPPPEPLGAALERVARPPP